MKTKHAPWLADAVFYEIYPQSFCDTNGDGMREQIASTPLQPLYDVETLPSPSLLQRLLTLLGALFRRTA